MDEILKDFALKFAGGWERDWRIREMRSG